MESGAVVLPKDFFSEDEIKDIKSDSFYPEQLLSAIDDDKKDKLNRKDLRNKAILALIAKKGNVNIKDISLSIKGCSEKTVQRELNLLIKLGIVKKSGERRWSRYFLA